MKKYLKLFLYSSFLLVIIVAFLGFSITQLDDKFSVKMRNSLQHGLNSYIEELSKHTASNSLTSLDTSLLHLSAFIGIVVSRASYPEASKLLYHYIYGNGDDLELGSSYFQSSQYVQNKVRSLGNGQYGPLSLKQKDDWRLSLALNPYYLYISDKQIRIFHPKIEFAPPSNQDIVTVVPIGKLKIKVYDNIVSALNPSPFYVFSEWER